jgi:carbon-monoxide dehydrogenase large subunit
MQGAIAQGIGGAIYEHLIYDESGQLLTASLMDYLLPASTEIPPLELRHLAFPSPTTLEGIRGVGEGGTLGPYAAIANAVADALAPFDLEINDLPVSPDRLHRALSQAARRV